MRPCETCGLMHPPLTPCLEAMKANVRTLLLKIARIDRCPPPCGEEIYWVTHLTGARAPYTKAGLLHFLDCTGKYRKERS